MTVEFMFCQWGHGLIVKAMVCEATHQGLVSLEARISCWCQVQVLGDFVGRVFPLPPLRKLYQGKVLMIIYLLFECCLDHENRLLVLPNKFEPILTFWTLKESRKKNFMFETLVH